MTTPTIDRGIFTALAEATGADFARELIDTFLQEAPTMLAELHRAATAQDAAAFRRAAHSLKSNANTFGAMDLATMARALEIEGQAMPDEHKAHSLDALDEEYARVALALNGLRDE